jgi:hypothetical protein
MKSFLLLCLFILSGCSGPQYGEEYNVYIHPDFGSKIENIVEAAQKWHIATGVWLNVSVAIPHHCEDTGSICMVIANEPTIIDRVGYVSPDGYWSGVTNRSYKDYSRISILDMLLVTYPDPVQMQNVTYVLNETIMHEFGHAFGLDHDPQKGNVMYKDAGGGALVPTCRDLMQYYTLRGIDYYC